MIFRDIDANSVAITSMQLRGEGRAPLPFLKIEKSVLILERKPLIVSIFGLLFPFVDFLSTDLRVSWRKNSKMFPCVASFSCVFDEMFIEVPYFHKIYKYSELCHI